MRFPRGRKLAIVPLAALAVTVLAITATPAVETDFIAARFFPAGDQTQSLVSADFNNDGHQDVAALNTRSTSSTISVFLGNGSGSFGPALTFPAGDRPRSIVSADFNSDGKLDLANTQIGGQGFGVSLGNGDGTFAALTSFPIGDFAEFLVAGDFNEDGKQDLVVSSRGLGRTLLFRGNGAGGWSSSSILASGFTPSCLAKGDFNGDSHLDLTVGRGGGSSLLNLLGDGHGNFGVVSTPALPSDALSVSMADLNGDGKIDLVAAGNDVTVLIGDGFGTFTSTTYGAGGKGYSIKTTDFDGDGKLDVAVALLDLSSVSILKGSGTGALAAPTLFRAGAWATDLAIADFNEDGRWDVAMADMAGDDISLLLGDGKGTLPVANRIETPRDIQQLASRDFNEDGQADILAVDSWFYSFYAGNGAGGFGPPQTSGNFHPPVAVGIADLNGDGHLDLACAEPRYSPIEEPPDPHLTTYLGSGTGAFTLHQDLSLAIVPNFLVTGRFSADSAPDAVVAPSTGGLTLYLGDGTGNLTAGPSFSAGVVFRYLSVADLDKDGFLDIIALGGPNAVFYGNESGGFSQGPTLSLNGGTPREAITGDFNEDGIIDIAVAACVAAYPYPPGSVTLFLGDGARGFAQASGNPDAGDCPMRINAADFNRDGHLDLAVGDNFSRRMSVLLGAGNTTFLRLPGFLVPSDDGLVVADFDGNGLPDLAGASIERSVNIALNRTQSIQVALSGGLIAWNAIGGASTYDLVAGDLQILHSTGGDFTAAVQDCLVEDFNGTSYPLTANPSPGQGFWFLARADVGVGAPTYESGSPTQVGLRDPEIDASLFSCP